MSKVPFNPAYTYLRKGQTSIYYRPDALDGIRDNDNQDEVNERLRARENGTRDASLPRGLKMYPTFAWVQDHWDFTWGWGEPLGYARNNNLGVWLRPSGLGGHSGRSYPKCFDVQENLPGGRDNLKYTQQTRLAVQTYYEAFLEDVVEPNRDIILGIDVSGFWSYDAGQISVFYPGGGDVTEKGGIRKEDIEWEIRLQRKLFGNLAIGHIGGGAADLWVDTLFRDLQFMGFRNDSSPFRETVQVIERMVELGILPEEVLHIGEIYGGNLSSWTRKNGKWAAEFQRFWGTDYPYNVQRCFAYCRKHKVFIWPMNEFPTEAEQPEYWNYYLLDGTDGEEGALKFVPKAIESFMGVIVDPGNGDTGGDLPPDLVEQVAKNTQDIKGHSIAFEELSQKVNQLQSSISDLDVRIERISKHLKDTP